MYYRKHLARGHELTAIARHPEKLAGHPSITKTKHDLLDDVLTTSKLLSGHDLIIYAFNPKRQSKDPDIFEQPCSRL